MEKNPQSGGEFESLINYKDFVYYDPSSFSGLRWVESFGPKSKKNNEVGCFKVMSNGEPDAIVCQINGVRFRVHRIIWEMFNGPIPEGMVIDHLNGNPWDNRIENLACKSQKDNSKNSKKKKNNSSGVTGVYWTIKPVNHLYAVARWTDIDGKQSCKCFSARDLGKEEAFKQACEARKIAINWLKSVGQPYTERNGK